MNEEEKKSLLCSCEPILITVVKFCLLFFSPITPSDEDLINILPGYPIQYNPVEVRLYVRVKTGPNAHLPLDKDVLLLIFQSFLRNVSDTLGVQISGEYLLKGFSFVSSWKAYN